MLLAVYLYEDLVNVEGIAVASVLPFQAAGINGAKLDAPEPDGFAANGDTAFRQQVFNISVAQIEAIVEPDGVTDDIGWESMTLISIQGSILSTLGT